MRNSFLSFEDGDLKLQNCKIVKTTYQWKRNGEMFAVRISSIYHEQSAVIRIHFSNSCTEACEKKIAPKCIALGISSSNQLLYIEQTLMGVLNSS